VLVDFSPEIPEQTLVVQVDVADIRVQSEVTQREPDPVEEGVGKRLVDVFIEVDASHRDDGIDSFNDEFRAAVDSWRC